MANSTDEKKLYLLDAFALIFRSYFAFAKNPIINSKGQNTSAILGFVNTLNLLLKKTNSTHIAVCFDSAEQTQREEVFADYKANRAETPEDIKFAVPYIKAIVKAFNIPLIEKPGYEADDIKKPKLQVTMCTWLPWIKIMANWWKMVFICIARVLQVMVLTLLGWKTY